MNRLDDGPFSQAAVLDVTGTLPKYRPETAEKRYIAGAKSRDRSQFNRGGKKILNAFDEDEDEDVDVDVEMMDFGQSEGIKLNAVAFKNKNSFLDHKPDFGRTESKFKKLPVLSNNNSDSNIEFDAPDVSYLIIGREDMQKPLKPNLKVKVTLSKEM